MSAKENIICTLADLKKRRGPVRFAIYTRKSTDEGLEKDYNSLDSQYDFCRNYFDTIKEDNFELITESYDDGGYSGGTINRPALQRLLNDISAGLVNCVLIYRVDRLTRCTSDFYQLAAIFKEFKVDFISVKEKDMFNTTSAMGRLLLQMFLMFAQFERENAGERIRDKVANSKARGIWMGGTPQLGYDISNRKLIINESEAQIIRLIYEYFITTHSVGDVVDKLNSQKRTTKSFKSEAGNIRGGKNFSTTAVLRILQNSLYKGMVKHQDHEYKGEHPAIIDEKTWDEVQDIFLQNKANRGRSITKPDYRTSDAAILRGLIRCGSCGCALTPSYCCKGKIRYRYYRCNNKTKKTVETCSVTQVSAEQIEKVVLDQVLEILRTKEFFVKYITVKKDLDFSTAYSLFGNIEKIWNTLFELEKVRILRELITQVTVYDDNIVIIVNKFGMSTIFAELTKNNELRKIDYADDPEFSITIPYQAKRLANGAKIIEPDYIDPNTAKFSGSLTLMKYFAKAYKWQQKLDFGQTLADIYDEEDINHRDIRYALRISLIDPGIIEAVLDGKAPEFLTYHFMKTHKVPLLWSEQRKLYGIPERIE